MLRCTIAAAPSFAAPAYALANILHTHTPHADAHAEARALIIDSGVRLVGDADGWDAWASMRAGEGVGVGEGEGEGELFVVTVATSERIELLDLAESVKRVGLGELKVLGLGQRWEGLGSKMTWLREFVQHLPPHAIVVFVDAYDVLATPNCQTKGDQTSPQGVRMPLDLDLADGDGGGDGDGDRRDLRRRFESFNAPIVFSGEKNCAPDVAGEAPSIKLRSITTTTHPPTTTTTITHPLIHPPARPQRPWCTTRSMRRRAPIPCLILIRAHFWGRPEPFSEC